ncbi:MAG TPA: DUF4288 domain-containing protein [Thermoanaerobaculia bacterium]|jgi:hypothetical protein
MKWYGVKTLFRTRAVGRPRATDRYFDPRMTLVEERVVVYRARSFDDAIVKAEKDAHAYAKTTHENPYGQTVRMTCLGCFDAYELVDPLSCESGFEVYSRTEVVPTTETDAAVRRRLLGHETEAQTKRRRNVLNAEASGSLWRQ